MIFSDVAYTFAKENLREVLPREALWKFYANSCLTGFGKARKQRAEAYRKQDGPKRKRNKTTPNKLKEDKVIETVPVEDDDDEYMEVPDKDSSDDEVGSDND
jgi:hypothetical protein